MLQNYITHNFICVIKVQVHWLNSNPKEYSSVQVLLQLWEESCDCGTGMWMSYLTVWSVTAVGQGGADTMLAHPKSVCTAQRKREGQIDPWSLNLLQWPETRNDKTLRLIPTVDHAVVAPHYLIISFALLGICGVTFEHYQQFSWIVVIFFSWEPIKSLLGVNKW